MSKRIYLAAPYTDADKDVQQCRFSQTTVVAGELMLQGDLVYSPLTMGHVIAEAVDMPGDWEFWQKSCLSYLEGWATDLYILRLPGWDRSRGVTAELETARSLRLPVTHILPMNHTQALLRVTRVL